LHVQGKPVRMHIAPGLTLEEGPLNQVRHHKILAHGLAVQAMRAAGRPGLMVGPADNMQHALPVIDAPEHVKAAEAATRTLNGYFFVPMLEGRYDDAYLKSAGKDAPKFTDEEMKIIGSPLGFVGINVYIPTLLVMASDQPPGYREVPFNDSHPKMFSSWHRLAPESQYWSPRLLHSLWKPKGDLHHRERVRGERRRRGRRQCLRLGSPDVPQERDDVAAARDGRRDSAC
jgi:beta-glucosidase